MSDENTTDDDTAAGGVRRDHGCFGCGDANPCGLGLRFEPTGPGMVEARFVPRRQDEGFFGVVHGGDDFYYGLDGPKGTRLLSCVCSMETHGYAPAAPSSKRGSR